MPRQRYRSKLEVFRDVLVATRHSSKKTRIMGLANLNHSGFQKHMEFARDQGLIVVNHGDYCLTDRADRVLAALQELMAKSNELDRAIQSLERSAVPRSATRWSEGAVLRNVSRIAWNDVERASDTPSSAFARSGAFNPSLPGLTGRRRDIAEILSGFSLTEPATVTTARSGRSVRRRQPETDETLPRQGVTRRRS